MEIAEDGILIKKNRIGKQRNYERHTADCASGCEG